MKKKNLLALLQSLAMCFMFFIWYGRHGIWFPLLLEKLFYSFTNHTNGACIMFILAKMIWKLCISGNVVDDNDDASCRFVVTMTDGVEKCDKRLLAFYTLLSLLASFWRFSFTHNACKCTMIVVNGDPHSRRLSYFLQDLCQQLRIFFLWLVGSWIISSYRLGKKIFKKSLVIMV